MSTLAPEIWARGGHRTELAPGALDALRLLGVGRDLTLIRAAGARERWRVADVATGTAPVAVDAIEVDDLARMLTLTVCGGGYDPSRGGYDRPLIIRCEPVGEGRAAA